MSQAPHTATPLAWPDGWPRTPAHKRTRAKFGTTKASATLFKEKLSVAVAVERLASELQLFGVSIVNDAILSTNLATTLRGLPKSDQREPQDPGAAVYWKHPAKPNGPTRVMAIDIYDRVADNIAAIAATLYAMRTIHRHGGAVILERAFTGFAALPAPGANNATNGAQNATQASLGDWWHTLGLPGPNVTRADIVSAYRELAKKYHPDNGGDPVAMALINAARDEGLRNTP